MRCRAAVGAAVVFAALVAGRTWASTVVVSTTNEQVRRSRRDEVRRVTLGAQPLRRRRVSRWVWGVVVGVPTACVTAWCARRSNGSVS